MSKFDYMEFSTGGGHDRELVFHAKKYTPEEAIEIFCLEYEHLLKEGKIRKPELSDVREETVRYYAKAPYQCCWDKDSGIYSFCPDGQRGSFSVLTIKVDDLIENFTNLKFNASCQQVKRGRERGMKVGRDAVKLAQSTEDSKKIELDKLPIGANVQVKTRNSEYQFKKTSDYEFIGQGGWFKSPTVCGINGSTFGGSMLMVGVVCEGMRLEVSFPDRLEVLTTSTIREVEVEGASKRKVCPNCHFVFENPEKEEACMCLPEGKDCNDCRHYARCKGLGVIRQESQRTCDWWPIRFIQAQHIRSEV